MATVAVIIPLAILVAALAGGVVWWNRMDLRASNAHHDALNQLLGQVAARHHLQFHSFPNTKVGLFGESIGQGVVSGQISGHDISIALDLPSVYDDDLSRRARAKELDMLFIVGFRQALPGSKGDSRTGKAPRKTGWIDRFVADNLTIDPARFRDLPISKHLTFNDFESLVQRLRLTRDAEDQDPSHRCDLPDCILAALAEFESIAKTIHLSRRAMTATPLEGQPKSVDKLEGFLMRTIELAEFVEKNILANQTR